MTNTLTYKTRLAHLLSNGLHPFIVTSLTVPLVILFSGGSPGSAALWFSLFAGLVITPSLLLLLYQVRIRHVESADVAVRRQRTIFYVLGISGLLLLVAALHLLEAPKILWASVYAAIATNVIAASINHYVTKISVHAAAMAGCAVVLVIVSPVSGMGWLSIGLKGTLFALTVLQGWSRFYLGKHTPGQIMLGWGVAVLCVGVLM